MKISRLFEIVYILLGRKSVTANELAKHFEVSKRTILRDIETLSMANIPVCTSKGKGGGISILDNFILNKTTVSDEEQNQILFALQSLAPTQNADVSKVLSKLSSLFDKTDTDWIEVDFSRWGKTRSDKEKFEALKNAIIKKQIVSFAYSNSYGEFLRRTVYPLRLVFKSTAWYLQAYCLLREDYRIFKINRIFSVNVLKDSFAGEQFVPPPIDGDKIKSGAFVHLKMKFSLDAAYRIYDEFDPKNVIVGDDNSYTVEVDFPNDFWLYGFLLSFGTAVQVIEPKCVRDALLEQVNEIKIFYSQL